MNVEAWVDQSMDQNLDLLVERIAQPLGMNDTRISLSAEQLSKCELGSDQGRTLPAKA